MIRTGIGYDTHKLVKGNNLIVGGVPIPSNFKSVGHSDGDSLIHAIIDSILGAANLGDIGQHFPSDDKALKGSPSSYFLKEIIEKLVRNNYQIVKLFLNSFFGKFIALGITWSFSFQVLSEIRHLIMDLGYGFDLRISRITGVLALVGSFILTILFYLIGKNFF